MKKLFLSVIGMYIGILASFSQGKQPADSSGYRSRKLSFEEANIVSSYYSQDGNNSAVTGGIGSEKLTDIANVFDLKVSMKKIPIAVLAILTAVLSFGQKAGRPLSVIPIPVSVQGGNGNFTLTKSAAIETRTNNADAKRVAGFLAKKLSDPTGFAMPVRSGVSSNSNGNISITLNNDTTLGNEGYTLQVSPHIVSLSANKPAGLFYGMQTLVQLLPKEIESKTAVKNPPAGRQGVAWTIPCLHIAAPPRPSLCKNRMTANQ